VVQTLDKAKSTLCVLLMQPPQAVFTSLRAITYDDISHVRHVRALRSKLFGFSVLANQMGLLTQNGHLIHIVALHSANASLLKGHLHCSTWRKISIFRNGDIALEHVFGFSEVKLFICKAAAFKKAYGKHNYSNRQIHHNLQ